MSIQILAISDDFAPLASATTEMASDAITLAEMAFHNLPACAYVEFTVMSDDDAFEFRVEILTRVELSEGI